MVAAFASECKEQQATSNETLTSRITKKQVLKMLTLANIQESKYKCPRRFVEELVLNKTLKTPECPTSRSIVIIIFFCASPISLSHYFFFFFLHLSCLSCFFSSFLLFINPHVVLSFYCLYDMDCLHVCCSSSDMCVPFLFFLLRSLLLFSLVLLQCFIFL